MSLPGHHSLNLILDAKAKYAAPACLPEQNSPDPAEGTVCWTAGWGRMANKKLPDILQEVDLELISDETCMGTRNAGMLNDVRLNFTKYFKIFRIF